MNIKNRFIFLSLTLVAETGLTLTLWPDLGRAPPRRWGRPGSLSLPPPPGSAGGWPAACWPSCPSAYSRSWCGTPWHCQRNLPVKRLHGLMSIYQKLVTNFMSKLMLIGFFGLFNGHQTKTWGIILNFCYGMTYMYSAY